MRHKFAVYGRKALLNGSFNWTRGASEQNSENVIVADDPRPAAASMDKFEEMWGSLAKLR